MRLQCGIDEAGRGPLAGPVTAAAVMLSPDFDRSILADSKAMNAKARTAVASALRAGSIYGLGWATHYEIDRLNIHVATLLAMQRAHERMLRAAARAGIDSPWDGLNLVDGKYAPTIDGETCCVVGGDALHPEIMAASILAKTARDRWMCAYSRVEPIYGYEQHKGYPTVAHRALIAAHGPSRIQRRSFRIS